MTVGLVLVDSIVWMAASLGSFSFGGVERSGMKGKDLDIAGKSLMTHFSLSVRRRSNTFTSLSLLPAK